MKNSRKAVEERQMNILNLVRTREEVSAEEVASTFGISKMTVRRDLQYLEDRGLLKRTHGGAISLKRGSGPVTEEEKIGFCRDSISKFAARFVADGDMLFINGSMTALNMLSYLDEKRVQVFTNNCAAVSQEFPEHVSIHLTGGEVRSGVMIGDYVMRNLLNMSADKTFIGCAAVYDDGEFRYDIPTEIGINEAMISMTTGDIYILADHSKILRRSVHENSYGSCTYDRQVILITDDTVSSAVVERLRRTGMEVVLVPV